MNWLRNFMAGRYGTDQLSFFFILFYIIISILSQLFNCRFVSIVFLILPILAIYRMLSRDISKRYEENRKFFNLFNKLKKWAITRKMRFNDKYNRYFKCPHCKNQLRVPKGKGKIKITCPICKTQFEKKT